MSARVRGAMTRPLTAAAVCAVIFTAVVPPEAAQRPSQASTPEGQQPPAVPGGGGRGRGPAAPPRTARESAPVDLVGTWVSVVTEDWQWRMRTPPRGDVTSVPLNPAGRQMADAWNVADDGKCEAYGVGGIMRMPGRLRISWQDDHTLKIETDAGRQTRLLRFPAPGAAATRRAGRHTLQGDSVANWVLGRGAFDAFLERGGGAAGPRQWGSLTVTTTNVSAGWLRRNGVPYSQNAVISEQFTRFTHPVAGDWFVVTTTVDDPTYLAQPFTTSSNFKKEPDDSKWSPVACRG